MRASAIDQLVRLDLVWLVAMSWCLPGRCGARVSCPRGPLLINSTTPGKAINVKTLSIFMTALPAAAAARDATMAARATAAPTSAHPSTSVGSGPGGKGGHKGYLTIGRLKNLLGLNSAAVGLNPAPGTQPAAQLDSIIATPAAQLDSIIATSSTPCNSGRVPPCPPTPATLLGLGDKTLGRRTARVDTTTSSQAKRDLEELTDL